ncbi:MAG: DNA mismatch repair protein MutS [Spirochaetales bacterium]|nr:DNA mismatch repair protein MutS [Spirochaetales bacterium]
MSEPTPMMKQYLSIKEQHKDAVLFFRMGDFYEMFRDDAREVSRLLNLTLTKRQGISMCGIPYHASQNYIGRLLKLGKKVAICEQTELPPKGKGLAKREVVEIITPGTIVEEDFLDKGSNNYLASIGYQGNDLNFSYIDLSTGAFFTSLSSLEGGGEFLRSELFRLAPGEIILQESLLERQDYQFLQEGLFILNKMPDWSFDTRAAEALLCKQFGLNSLKAFGIKSNSPLVLSPGVLIQYIEDTAKSLLPHISTLKVYSESDYLALDEATRKNLELVKNLQDGTKNYTLFEILDQTMTPMGTRLLKNWIQHPLKDYLPIQHRQERVELLHGEQIILQKLREELKPILDLERLTARVAMEKAHGKNLLAIGKSIGQYRHILNTLESNKELGELLNNKEIPREELDSLTDLLDRAILDEPSILLTEGRIIREGYNEELDHLRNLKKNSRQILDDYLESEKTNSGITTLKIKYNKIIGYFFDVTKSHLELVPKHFIRRQSLVGSERFTTERLGEIETEINSASDKIIELEKKLFLEVRSKVKEKLRLLQLVSDFFSQIDCLQSLAYCATINGYIKPILTENSSMDIINGRHPVVEYHLPPGEFIPNSLEIDSENVSFALITGPNMAGKSTFLRQTALITLMAQIGSFIPATAGTISIVDRIFCRVGATDNLARGESTFLVEMNETAYILRNSSSKSLIIMDEVGRGTSTEDGLSIAWAISEYLLDTIGAKTLFATHYHELSDIEHSRLKNLSLQVEERGQEILFLKKIKEGPSNNSYGIHVASLAGIPREVIGRAKEILQSIEKGEGKQIETRKMETATDQFGLFDEGEMILNDLEYLDINSMTPLEALNRLDNWKKRLSEQK